MQMRAAFRSGAGVSCLFAAAGAIATPPMGPACAPQSPEVMLYISRPIGGDSGGFRLPNLSLRFGQARMGANSGNPTAGDPLQHRELFRVEISGPQSGHTLDMHVGLGGRVSYDLKRGVFALRADGWKRPSAAQPVTSSWSPARVRISAALEADRPDSKPGPAR